MTKGPLNVCPKIFYIRDTGLTLLQQNSFKFGIRSTMTSVYEKTEILQGVILFRVVSSLTPLTFLHDVTVF